MYYSSSPVAVVVVVKFCFLSTRGRTIAIAIIAMISSINKMSNTVNKSRVHLMNKKSVLFLFIAVHQNSICPPLFFGNCCRSLRKILVPWDVVDLVVNDDCSLSCSI